MLINDHYKAHPEEQNVLFPVFLKLHHLRLLVVGGGALALSQLRRILHDSPDAIVTLIAKEIRHNEIFDLAANHPNITLLERSFKKRDLRGKHLVILATKKSKLSKKIREKAKKRCILTSMADKPKSSDFLLSTTVQKGHLKIGISTNGKSTIIENHLRDDLSEVLPEELDTLSTRLYEIKNQIKVDSQAKVEALDTITAGFMMHKKM